MGPYPFATRRREQKEFELRMSSPSLLAAQAALARATAEKAKQRYQQTQATTVTPGQVIILLYDGALRFLRRACMALDDGDLEAAHNMICRAQDIVLELDATLDDKGGAVALNLHRIYAYCLRQLIEGNMRKEAGPITEVIQHLEQLVAAWRQAVASVETTGTSGNTDGAQIHMDEAK